MAVKAKTAGSRRELRRGEIVAAARAIVAKDGLDALTIGALEKRLAFTRGVITYHFRDKDDIVEAVLRSAVAEIDEATFALVAATLNPKERVRAVVRANVRGFLDHIEASRILVSFWSRLATDRRAARLNAQLYATYRERCAALVEAGKATGDFADVPTREVAALIVGTVIGIVTQHYFSEYHRASGRIDVDRAIDEACETILARLKK